MIYNMMTCKGFGTSILGGCTMAWLGFVIILFLCLVARRQIEDHLSMSFNLVFALVLGLLAYVVIITFTGAIQWSFLGGVGGSVLGGFGAGWIMGLGGESYG